MQLEFQISQIPQSNSLMYKKGKQQLSIKKFFNEKKKIHN